jgi:hypothetical protein
MSRKSQETIGPNVGIRVTTESNSFRHERLLFNSQRVEKRCLFGGASKGVGRYDCPIDLFPRF